MSRDGFSEEDKILWQTGVGKNQDRGVEALCKLMKERATEIMGKILLESDPASISRMQGAARELLRWSDYPAELRSRMEWIEKEKER